MSVFDKVFGSGKLHTPYHPEKKPRYPEQLAPETLKNIFADCSDFQYREIQPGLCSDERLFVCWLDGICDGSGIAREVIRPLTDLIRNGLEPAAEHLLDGSVYSASAVLRSDCDSVVDDICSGHCAVVFPGAGKAVCFELKSKNQRSITEPTLEKSLKGAKDSFVEALRTNTALVRQRIRNPSLKLISGCAGRKSRTRYAVFYLDGVADPAIYEELLRRLDDIDVDALLATGSIEEYIVDRPHCPFPQLLHTERPDRFARQLTGGRVGLIVDGLPLAFILPVNFAEFLRVPQDDSQHFLVATALSLVRWFALVLSLVLPAFYVAIAMYHQEMIPTKLLLSVIESKQSVPFSTALEVLGMLIAFELLQEAGLRLPNPVGDTVSIIGALIVGQSAVEAKVISPIAVIVVALAGISSFALPNQDLSGALRLARFALVLAAILAGLFGVTALLCLIIWHLCTIDNFGTNYTAPLSGGRPHPLASTLLRKPKGDDKLRDETLNTPDRRRQK